VNLAFWDWVKFLGKGAVFPYDALVLGRYLGPCIDVVPAMTQHVMKENDEVEDYSMVRLLNPKVSVNATMHKEQEQFVASINDHWGLGTTVKDLGPDVLKPVPDPKNYYYPWKDEDWPSFPELDVKLMATEVTRAILSTLKCSSLLGICTIWQRSHVGNVTTRVIPWAQPTISLHQTPMSMRSGVHIAGTKNCLSMPLLRHFMPSALLIEMSMSYSQGSQFSSLSY
jgi:hypothetical protein